MMKKTWKKVLAGVCATVMAMTIAPVALPKLEVQAETLASDWVLTHNDLSVKLTTQYNGEDGSIKIHSGTVSNVFDNDEDTKFVYASTDGSDAIYPGDYIRVDFEQPIKFSGVTFKGGTDNPADWLDNVELFYSVDQGENWISIGKKDTALNYVYGADEITEPIVGVNAIKLVGGGSASKRAWLGIKDIVIDGSTIFDPYERVELSGVSAPSNAGGSGEGNDCPAWAAVDNNEKTHWHSAYDGGTYDLSQSGGTRKSEYNYIDVTLKDATDIDGVVYLPRQHSYGAGVNGTFQIFKVQVSKDGQTFTDVDIATLNGNAVTTAGYTTTEVEGADDLEGYYVTANYPIDSTTGYAGEQQLIFKEIQSDVVAVRISAKETSGGNNYMSAAEIDVLKSVEVDLDDAKEVLKLKIASSTKFTDPEVYYNVDEVNTIINAAKAVTEDSNATVEDIKEQIEILDNITVISIYKDNIGTFVYASDLPYDSESYAGWGDICVNKNLSGNPIKLTDGTSEITYDNGFVIHATGNLHYTLSDSGFIAFSSDYGIDSAQRGNANSSVTFKVLVDDEVKYTSEVMGGSTPLASTGLIDLKNATSIDLYADKGTADYNDHSAWGNAKFYLTKTAEFTDGTASLKGKIGVNFYAKVNDTTALENLSVKLTRGEDVVTTKFTEANLTDDGLYKFTFDVAAKEMTDVITAELISDGTTIDTTSLSVKAYADAAKAYYPDNTNLENLLNAMLNYGAAAQTHFGYNTANLANVGVEKDFTNVSIAVDAAASITKNIEGLDVNASLLLKSDTVLRFYLTAGEGADLSSYTVTPALVTGKTYAEITDIAAKDLGVAQTFEVTDGTNKTTVSYSPLHYAKAVAENTSTSATLKTVAKALYDYNVYAVTYFNNAQ